MAAGAESAKGFRPLSGRPYGRNRDSRLHIRLDHRGILYICERINVVKEQQLEIRKQKDRIEMVSIENRRLGEQIVLLTRAMCSLAPDSGLCSRDPQQQEKVSNPVPQPVTPDVNTVKQGAN